MKKNALFVEPENRDAALSVGLIAGIGATVLAIPFVGFGPLFWALGTLGTGAAAAKAYDHFQHHEDDEEDE